MCVIFDNPYFLYPFLSLDGWMGCFYWGLQVGIQCLTKIVVKPIHIDNYMQSFYVLFLLFICSKSQTQILMQKLQSDYLQPCSSTWNCIHLHWFWDLNKSYWQPGHWGQVQELHHFWPHWNKILFIQLIFPKIWILFLYIWPYLGIEVVMEFFKPKFIF